ncbi:putative DNA-binding transcriptional regulator YafY [Evansella vedderi]|uniref:DNA-binding transcriptional regulator YafY n=1 Tax=Evansella vedderi TaxID=38282 RepID=A0ABT9ZQ38_9BACI|nr:WYL domain-containing protein [Evansella vedderi]MDQ0253351.1 putative DNA-binding transcriptional regulator YafY [Evansella vedderi]
MITLPTDWMLSHKDTFALTVTGDSIIGAGIDKGDKVIVNKQNTASNGDIIIAIIGEELQLAFGNEYEVDARAIKRDFDLLNNDSFEIMENKGKFGKVLYSHQSRLFETYQLRLLIDPILSARFITNEEKYMLINKLKKLTSKHIAKSLPDPLIYNQSINENYQLIKLHIDKIHRAINEEKFITFQYGEYNVKKEFCLRKNGEYYELKAYALIWESDFYYLIGEHVRHENLSHYRLDRMRNIQLTDNKFIKQRLDISGYVQNTFQMFGGEDSWIKIQFSNERLVNPIIDKFGLEADIKKGDDGSFVLSTKAKISRGLINWILSWGDQAKVISPPHLVDEVQEIVNEMKKNYNNN